MKELDRIRVRDLLGQIGESRRRLDELARLPEAEFLADYRNTESAKYLLIVAIEAAIDTCNHIVACRGGRAPADYADCFSILADLGAIEAALADHLKRMARFRNLLVHLYWQVDNQRVHQMMQSELGDLDSFCEQIARWIET
jgi:uncharacterized protein YutE (UPF0331/DUF86 family)